jgi:large subunit ribosomal protein L17
MMHKMKGRKLQRTTAHRQALERNIVTSLFTYGRIITTVPKAKEFRGTVDWLVTCARKHNKLSNKGEKLHEFRKIQHFVKDERVAYKLINDIAKRYEFMGDKGGGYTRVLRLGGSRWDGDGYGQYAGTRLGDAGERAIWELTQRKEQDEELYSAGRGKKFRADQEAKELAAKAETSGEKKPAKKPKK